MRSTAPPPELDDPETVDEAARWLSMDSALTFHEAAVYLWERQETPAEFVQERYGLTTGEHFAVKASGEAKLAAVYRLAQRLDRLGVAYPDDKE